VRAADGSIIDERSWATARLGSYLKGRPPSRVMVETCAEAFRIADAARELGHDVRVVPAALVPSLGVGARGVKTDRRDARVLSEVSTRIELPSVHVPTQLSRTLKAACAAREALVTARTQLINATRGWIRTQLLRLPSGTSCTFTKRVRKPYCNIQRACHNSSSTCSS
jgi:transposase